MGATVVVGLNWGDESKATIVDRLNENADANVRPGGGTNSGHTLVINGKKIVLRAMPAGIMRIRMQNFAGPGWLCNPEMTAKEVKIAEANGASVMIDSRAATVTPWETQLDACREEQGIGALGTTRQGIGPANENKAARRGPRVCDLVSADAFRQALEQRNYAKERMALIRSYGETPMSVEQCVEWAMQYKGLHKYAGDTCEAVANLLAKGKNVIFELTQGVLLDPDIGTYPFVTSGKCVPDCVRNMGIHDFMALGVLKGYGTRVGAGPMPTEFLMDDAVGMYLSEKGAEFGSATGRARRCAWLDLFATLYACRMAKIDRLAVTKLDVLSGLDEILVCTGYKVNGQEVGRYATLTTEIMQAAKPIYKKFPGWKEDISGCGRLSDLPWQTREYLAFISSYLNLEICMVGVRADREGGIMC